ncbi:MAG: 1-acyl-sn-glycerol-3-phosphate acyltransferase [Desulfobacter sp.]|nr:MAG: 1-acyl-sn-glycerol-3-phosphate acyltransferase [Desulfobacter sp.]
MAVLKSLYRLFWVVEVTLYSVFKLGMASPSKWQPGLAARHARRWAAALVRGLDIHIRVKGRVPGQGMLVVANHRSYLDIVVILSQMEAAFLAKAELKTWPVFGYAAQKGNTVFVERGDAASRARARQALADRIHDGVTVVIFPEGTTTAGPGLLPFKNGIFNTAAQQGIPVVPVAVTYDNPEAAWIGNDFFIPHFIRIFKSSPLKARLTFGPVLEEADGGSLKSAAHSYIEGRLAIEDRNLPN